MSVSYSVRMVSCYDDSYPSENINNGVGSQLWATTGTYPQCVVVSMEENTSINALEILSCNVKELRIEGTSNKDARQFEEITQQEIPAGNLQKTTVSDIGSDYQHLKIIILSGHEHFASIHDLIIK